MKWPRSLAQERVLRVVEIRMIGVVGEVDADADGAERGPHGVATDKKLLIGTRCIEVDGHGADGSGDAGDESVVFLVHIPERQVGEDTRQSVLTRWHGPEGFGDQINDQS